MRQDIPSVCTLPTGVGKTSVIALWLLALSDGAKLPRRLVYVVNRRTVVDQTTAEVERLRKNLPSLQLSSFDALSISTLRGQFADNRDWSTDPSRPAVIAGTVDMIGSRLLFSGYRIGFKSKPLHAGFLGQDALLVHDEAHLEPAFQKLIASIENEQRRERERSRELSWPTLRVMQLTATARGEAEQEQDGRVFTLTEREQKPESIPDPPTEPIHHIWLRLKAEKQLHLTRVDDEKAVAPTIADIAARYKNKQSAVLVFVRTLGAVEAVEEELKKTKCPVELLTGTIRGKERDELVTKPEFQRFLKGAPSGETVYLVCTSAGEVGIDVSADHMVCDLTTFESMAQRFGRVNRYGVDHAGKPKSSRIDVVYPSRFDDKDRLKSTREATLKLLQDPRLEGNASPLNLAKLDPRETAPAFTPEPIIPPVTDILFDSWALTTIRQPMPGRTEVAPYLHGIADDLPQTTIAWRAELDLLKDDPDPKAALTAVFTKHRIRPHETLTVGMTLSHGKWKFRAIEFLEQMTTRVPDLRDTRVGLIFSHGLELMTVGELINASKDNAGPLNADPTLVLPASFGGLSEDGLLSASKSERDDTANSEVDGEGELTEENRASSEKVVSLDIADFPGYEREPGAPPRTRLLMTRSDKGWIASPFPSGAYLPVGWNVEEPQPTSTRLVKHLQESSGLKVRLVQPVRRDEEGDLCSLVCLAPPPKRTKSQEQTLDEHVSLVEKEADRLASALLDSDNVASAALRFAAKWHDEGKKADRWQRYIGRNENAPLLGKSAEWRDPTPLAGYRHEFGSLLRIARNNASHYLADPALKLTIEQQEDALELALHLIATHHGYARPHFIEPWADGLTTAECEQMHTEVLRRFGRLQRKYGRWGLAYLESLLRAADWSASAAAGIDAEVDDDDLDTEGVE
jgi:CRISPR-associated endonuclease/helicase Cas3